MRVIITGNCDCKSGLGSTCTHVAALLFLIEAVVRIREIKGIPRDGIHQCATLIFLLPRNADNCCFVLLYSGFDNLLQDMVMRTGWASLWMQRVCLRISRNVGISIEVSQSRDILTSHTFVTPYWRSSHSLPGMLWYGVDIVKVFI